MIFASLDMVPANWANQWIYNIIFHLYHLLSKLSNLFEHGKFFTRMHVNDFCFKLVIQGDKLNCWKIIRIKLNKINWFLIKAANKSSKFKPSTQSNDLEFTSSKWQLSSWNSPKTFEKREILKKWLTFCHVLRIVFSLYTFQKKVVGTWFDLLCGLKRKFGCEIRRTTMRII